MYGLGLLTTYRMTPCAIRRSVASASGRSRSKMLGQGRDQSMQLAAVSHGFKPLPFAGFCACVAAGQTIGIPSQRATRNSRLRIVGAP